MEYWAKNQQEMRHEQSRTLGIDREIPQDGVERKEKKVAIFLLLYVFGTANTKRTGWGVL